MVPRITKWEELRGYTAVSGAAPYEPEIYKYYWFYKTRYKHFSFT